MSNRYKGKTTVYALYHGDEFVDVGTAAEIAERHGVKPVTIAYYAQPSYLKRFEGRDGGRPHYEAVRL